MANKRLEEVTYRSFDPQPVLQQKILPLEIEDGTMLRRVAAGLARVADVFYERGANEAQAAGLRNAGADVLANAPGASTIEGGDIEQTTTQPAGLRVQVAPANIRSAIDAAAKRNGVPADALTMIAQVESGFDPNARNPRSTAAGLFQFVDGTARQYGLTNKFDPVASSEAAARLMSDNKRALEGRLGRPVSAGELYLAHQQGAKGAIDLLANPNAKAADIVGLKAVTDNGGDADMTAAEFAGRWTAKFDSRTVRAEQRRENSPFDLIMADGSKPDIDGVKPAVLTAFQDLQNAWGKQIPIKSGFRDADRNRDAGGAKHSQHMHGNALDLDVKDVPLEERKELIRTASALGFKGIGVYQNSLHLDMGGRRAWGPSHHKESVPDWAQDVIGEHLAEKATSERAAKYQDTSADDGPVKVTPVRTPLVIKTNPGRWQPTRSNTIYGRAYDVAGTKTYLQMAKMQILEDQAVVYEKFKDDPVQLRAAMDQLLEAHRRDGILPEIAPEYELSFRQNALGHIQQAQSNFEKLKLQQDTAALYDRVSTLEDRKSQLLVGADPRDPSSAAMLEDIQGTIDSHYDSAVARGLMKPLEAAQAKREGRSEMMVGFYLKQANGLNVDELDQLQAKMADDYAAGSLKGVTATDWGKIEDGLRAARKYRETEDGKATADLGKRGEDIFARVLRGEPVPPSDITKLRTDAHLVPDGDSILASTDARMRLANALRTRPIGEVENQLGEILKRPDGTVNPVDTDFARQKIAEVRKDLVADPLGVAERFGLVPPVPPITLDGMKDPAALRDALSARWGSAVAASWHFGTPVKFFRPGEADQLQAIAMQDPDAMVAFTLNASQAFGKDTPKAMQEISEQGPIMAHAVGLSIATGDASLARDVAKISVLKAKKELDVKIPVDALTVRANETLAGALMAQPELQTAAIGTAKLLFEKMAAEQGFDPAQVKDPSSVAAAAWEKALDRALGGQVMNGDQYGGLGTVNDRQIIVPPFMRKDQVESIFYGLSEKQLAKLAPRGTINGIDVTAAQMKDGYLVSIGAGLYRVALNDPQGDDPAYVIDKSGKPWVLDINALEKLQVDKPQQNEFRRWRGSAEE